MESFDKWRIYRMVRFPIRLVDTFVSPQQPVSQPDENLSLFWAVR